MINETAKGLAVTSVYKHDLSITECLERFPKVRTPLSPKELSIYQNEYLSNREGGSLTSSLAQKLESWMHKQVSTYVTGGDVLEIGAGTLNQIPYFKNKKFDSYDAIEPMKFLYQNSQHKNKVQNFFSDIRECSNSYDAIFSVAVLEHITNLPETLAKAATLLKENGVCVSAIPCESGFLWGISWRLSTGIAYKLRTGYSYKNLMRHEHVNNFDEIVALHKHFFNTIKLVYFPIPNKHLSFYCCIIARDPKLQICRQYL